MPRLFVVPFLVLALTACPPAEDRGGGGPHCSGPSLPVGATEDSDFIFRCRFSEPTDWIGTAGATKHWVDGARYYTTCSPQLDASYDCFEACADIAEQFGVADTNTACTNTYATHELLHPPFSCGWLQLCNAEDWNEPQVPEPDDVATLFCMADPDEAEQPHDCDMDPGALWWIDDDGQCGSQSPTTVCGFPVYGVEPGDDPDQQCKDLCASQIAHPFTDANITNCDNFVHAETCESGIAPRHGRDFHWQTEAGPAPSPLVCDGPCCGEFGAAACANLAGAKVIAPVAQHHTAITVPVRLDAHGVVSTGTVTGVLAYSVTACGAGRTCPLYVESLALAAARPLTGTWVDASGRRLTFTLDKLALASTGPALGGYRPATGELQLRPHTLALDITADVSARSVGWTDASLGLVGGNVAPITGRITPSSVTLSTMVQLAPGVRLVLGP